MPRTPYTWRQPPYPGDESDLRWIDPSMIVIGENGDIDTAIGPLLRTLGEPIAKGIVGAVFVHETMRERLIERVRDSMMVIHRQVKRHKLYARTLRRLECLGAEQVCMMKPDDIGFQYSMVDGSPIIVCDFTQSYFTANRPSTIVTLHTFRNSIELGDLAAKEKLPFVSASVWCPKTAVAYEIALMLRVPVIYINCSDVSLLPIASQMQDNEAISVLASGYHYEIIIQNNQSKVVVFPAPVQLIPKSSRP